MNKKSSKTYLKAEKHPHKIKEHKRSLKMRSDAYPTPIISPLFNPNQQYHMDPFGYQAPVNRYPEMPQVHEIVPHWN